MFQTLLKKSIIFLQLPVHVIQNLHNSNQNLKIKKIIWIYIVKRRNMNKLIIKK